MRKIIPIFILMFLLLIVGCNQIESVVTTTENDTNPITLDDNQSLAFATYLSSGILNSSSNEINVNNFNSIGFNPVFLSTEDEVLEVETDLNEVNVYFDKLKVFMDNGVDSALTIQDEDSTNVDYDKQVTYTIDGVVYTIYYSFLSVDEVTTEETTVEEELENHFNIIGLMIIDEVEFDLEGYSIVEDNEEKMVFNTVERENTNNYVRIKIKNDEGMQRFDLVSMIDGVENRTDVKFIQEDNATKVQLRLYNGEIMSSYLFKKIVEDDKTLYMLNYHVGDTQGVIKIFVTVDELGETVYRYQINEGGKSKQIEKGKNDRKNSSGNDNSKHPTL